MSRQRLFAPLAALCGALFFTVSAPAQEVLRGEANLLHRAPIEYPAEAIANGIQGTVTIEATLNERGVVIDARVVSGPPPLRRGALKSVLDWHYSAQAQSPVEVVIDFKLPLKTPVRLLPGGAIGGVIGGVTGGIIGGVPAPVAAESGRLKRIQFTAVSAQLRETLPGRLPVREGDEIQPDMLTRIRQALRDVDEHLDARLTRGEITTETIEAGRGFILTIYSTTPMATSGPVPPPQRIRVGGTVQAAQVLNAPKPVYPPLAKQARIQGAVRLNVIIGKDGTVQDVAVESGHPLLVPAAIDAVRQWAYRPTALNGQPVEVDTVVDVNFTLSDPAPGTPAPPA